VKDLNGEPYYMGATIIVKNNAGLLDLLVMKKKEVTKYSNFLGGPYVIAQYLVWEVFREVLYVDVLTVDFLCRISYFSR
jgi:hypothetical protein